MCVLCVISRPEDRGHQEEAAAVHRAVQVAPQLAESLVRLRHASGSCPHQPGQNTPTHTPTHVILCFILLHRFVARTCLGNPDLLYTQ